MNPQPPTISQRKFSRNLWVSRPTASFLPFLGHFPLHGYPRNAFKDPFITKHFRAATCFRIKRLNCSGLSCFHVFLLQHPPEPGPVGVTQKAHSGYSASPWERLYQSGETGAAKDEALKNPTADGPEEAPERLLRKPKGEENVEKRKTPNAILVPQAFMKPRSLLNSPLSLTFHLHTINQQMMSADSSRHI